MFELSASEFHRGVLHIEVEKSVSKFRKWANSIGPVKARIASIIVLAFAFFLTINPNPAKFMLASGYADSLESAMAMQLKFSYVFVGLAVLMHVVLGFWKREFMLLDFDKTKAQLRFFHQRAFNYSRPAEGFVPFSQIKGIHVVKGKTTENSVGYVELDLPESLGKAYDKVQIALLSDEQMSFYPLNLYRITGIQPKGDWTDPDDEMVKT
ncbi:MAG TPA: hypothetical protein VM901_10190 [Bdellovibrionota bacterium]|jgi:hypothetical protein|nr:hypothetical protein [Bdellovibrionota bacterium]